MTRATVDRLTYLRVLENQIEYYTRLGVADAELKAKQAVAAAFCCDEALDLSDFQKDHDDARRDREWTTA